MSSRPMVHIIGGGPAGLIAADHLAATHEVHLYEQGRTVGRKFLVAGAGGLNITNRAEGEELFDRFTPRERMRLIIEGFGPSALRGWLAGLGVPTFVGTSGRVFPERPMKPAQVLATIKDRLIAQGVSLHMGHSFTGFDANARPVLEREGGREVLTEGLVLFALGGASWPVTGSTGDWARAFKRIDVDVLPFQAGNCGVELDIPEALRVHAGKALKNIRVTSGALTVRGEATLTETGLEGNAIYPIVPAVRQALTDGDIAELSIDLKPDVTEEELQRRLAGAAWKERMSALKLDRVQVAMLKAFTPVQRFVDGSTLAHDVKHLRLPVKALRPIHEAISTVGGIAWEEVGDDLALRKHPHIFVAGEMIDWDAPTGGFLLQGCFAMGRMAASAIADRAG